MARKEEATVKTPKTGAQQKKKAPAPGPARLGRSAARPHDELSEQLARLKAAYSDLRESEERYRLVFDNLPLGYMSMDENARIIDVNKTFADFFGYTYDEITGKYFAELLAEDAEADYHRNVSFPAFKRTGTVQNVVWKVLKKDGSPATVSMNGRVRYDESGRFIQTHCMMMDVTEHKKAEEALRKSEREKALILGAMSERVVYHDENRRIIWANRVGSASREMTPEEMPGRLCFEAWRGRSTPCENCPAMRVFNTHRPARGEVHADSRVLEMAARPVMDENNRFVGVVQISSDITERKSLEKEILELSGKERSRIGHDLHDGLGQYLAGISFLATALHQQLAAENSKAQAMAEQIIDSADKAKKLMRSILQGLCLVTDEPQGFMSALTGLAHNMEDLYRVPCSLVYEEDVLIYDYAVSTHLFFIAHEALTNAIKHSACSRIRILLDPRDGVLTMSVEDDGKGMSPREAATRGMGLRIMRYRASGVRATLEIISAPGKGTTVTCRVPLSTSGKD